MWLLLKLHIIIVLYLMWYPLTKCNDTDVCNMCWIQDRTTHALGLHLYCVIFLLSCDFVILSVVAVHSQTFQTGIVTTMFDYYRFVQCSTSDNALCSLNVFNSCYITLEVSAITCPYWFEINTQQASYI